MAAMSGFSGRPVRTDTNFLGKPWLKIDNSGDWDLANLDPSVPSVLVQTGWQCPICKRVYAPHVDECKGCGDE